MPFSSEVVDRTPTRFGLFASTVAPGNTAPDTSFTTPSIDPRVSCARAPVATDSTSARAPSKQAYFFILDSSTECPPAFLRVDGILCGRGRRDQTLSANDEWLVCDDEIGRSPGRLGQTTGGRGHRDEGAEWPTGGA